MARVLFLHGYTSSASIFRKKTGALRKAMAQHDPPIEAVFLDGPYEVPTATEPRDSLEKYDSSLEDPDDRPRAWWFAADNADGTKTYKRFDETMRYLADYLKREPPFDGVFGFSQGAALAAVLSVFLRRPELHPAFADARLPGLRFAVLVGGFPVADPDLSFIWTAGLASTPSLHVIGRGDTIVGEDRSGPLVSAFDRPRVERHDGGHFVPSSAAWRAFLVEWMASFGNDPPRDVPAPRL